MSEPNLPSKPPQEPDQISTHEIETGDEEIDSLPISPLNITGKSNINPRRVDEFPMGTDERVMELMQPSINEDKETQIIGEEFSSQMSKMMASHCPNIPPKPLTVNQLEHELADFPVENSKYTCWVSCEKEYIKDTAAGEYREYVEGNILRFTLDLEGEMLMSFELVPDFSPTGFSWYRSESPGMIEDDALLDLSQSRRLQALRDADNVEKIINLEEKFSNASHLTERPLTGTQIDPTPKGWVVTQCKIDEDHAEIGFPRYKGTFVHKESGIVIEFSGLAPEGQFQEQLLDQEQESPKPLQLNTIDPKQKHEHSHPEEKKEDNTHEVEVHFAPDTLTEDVESRYGEEVKGNEIYHMMRFIHKHLPDHQ